MEERLHREEVRDGVPDGLRAKHGAVGEWEKDRKSDRSMLALLLKAGEKMDTYLRENTVSGENDGQCDPFVPIM